MRRMRPPCCARAASGHAAAAPLSSVMNARPGVMPIAMKRDYHAFDRAVFGIATCKSNGGDEPARGLFRPQSSRIAASVARPLSVSVVDPLINPITRFFVRRESRNQKDARYSL